MSAITASRSPPVSAFGWLRIGLRIASLVALLIIAVPFYYAIRPFRASNPVPRWFFAAVCAVLGLSMRVTGERARADVLLLPNHVTWLDIPALGALTGTAFVAHDGLASIGWLRWLCELNGTVFIAREDRRDVARQIEQVRAALGDTGTLAIFAEGTTSQGDGFLPFKSALLSAVTPLPEGISVQPVWMDYGPASPETAWVGEESGKDNFLAIAARAKPVRLTVHFLPPLAGEALSDRKAMASAAQQALSHRKSETERARDQRVAL